MVDSSITFDELLLSEDDFITQGPLLVILEDEEVAAPHLDIIDMIDIIDRHRHIKTAIYRSDGELRQHFGRCRRLEPCPTALMWRLETGVQ